ncbi:MAG: protein-ADP-ribose hydrolase [Mogibacterium sp.]|nr:protein-ADP-ribose hydrolase [Mogibacterium sp.]
MRENTSQQQRLDYLVESFKNEAPEYRRVVIPNDTEGKQRLLRSLMNVRMPKPASSAVLSVQDKYLRGRALEKGIVNISEMPTVRESLGSTHAFADNISIWQGDITRIAADGIVNAANSQMLGCFIPMHACIDNCIHTYAGVQLREECARRMGSLRLKFGESYEQPTAVPMLTDAYNLPAKNVIHIVGPIVQYELTPQLEKDLADCYINTLDMCKENGLRSVAFCCISTGVFHFPNKRAAEIAVHTVTDWLNANPGTVDRVIFNVFKDEDKMYYEELFV